MPSLVVTAPRKPVSLENLVLSAEDYLNGEPARLERHEFVDGQIRAMAGAGRKHEEVALELATLLKGHLRGKPCKVYKGDLKLRIKQKTSVKKLIFYYPDIMVVCDPKDNHEQYATKPRVIIEVLSNDKGRDLIEKLAVYREITSLEEYLVVGCNAERPEVYIFRRRSGFEPIILTKGSFEIEALQLRMTVKEIYQS